MLKRIPIVSAWIQKNLDDGQMNHNRSESEFRTYLDILFADHSMVWFLRKYKKTIFGYLLNTANPSKCKKKLFDGSFLSDKQYYSWQSKSIKVFSFFTSEIFLHFSSIFQKYIKYKYMINYLQIFSNIIC